MEDNEMYSVADRLVEAGVTIGKKEATIEALFATQRADANKYDEMTTRMTRALCSMRKQLVECRDARAQGREEVILDHTTEQGWD